MNDEHPIRPHILEGEVPLSPNVAFALGVEVLKQANARLAAEQEARVTAQKQRRFEGTTE